MGQATARKCTKIYSFLKRKHPNEVDSRDVKRFLSYIAVEKKVSASTQNQAFSALLFLFRHVLDRDLTDVAETVRAKPKRRLPVVLTRQEIQRIFGQMSGVHLLMARFIYGCGLRVQECVDLRVKNIDFEQGALTVRSGKGDKDRLTDLPESLKNDLLAHLIAVRQIFDLDFSRQDAEGVALPNALERKYPNRDRERPRGPSPPTPPGIRITYQGGSADYVGLAADRGFGILRPA